MPGILSTDAVVRVLQATPEQWAVLGALFATSGGVAGAGMALVVGPPAAGGQEPEVGGRKSEDGGLRSTSLGMRDMVAGIQRDMAEVRKDVSELRRAEAKAAAGEPATDDEARRLFALLKALESEGDYRKAPVTRVFQLYCMEGLKRDEVAKKCRCVPALVTLRLKAIEARLGRKASELRQLSGHFERIAESLSDDRARHVHHESAMDRPEDDE